MKRVGLLLTVVACVVMLVPALAFADSISPASVSATLGVGESLTVTKTVTVDEGTPTTSKVDVFFLTDSTGSMTDEIAAVKSSASTILSSVAGLGDVAFGVGEYKDITDSFTYRSNTELLGVAGGLTTNQATAQSAINMWGASGGGDYPEANMYGLEEVAENTSWREGSTRILVWFGDAPGHDPRAGSTQASATAALQAEDIVVQAINVAPSSWDLYAPYGDIYYGLNDTGQASDITADTGGTLYSGIDSSSIVDTIQDAIYAVFAEYSTVSLDVSGVPAGVDVAVAPGSYTGSYDRSMTRTFDFDVTFTGTAAGTYDFDIYGTVDGARVAREIDHIVVEGEAVIPEPGTMLLLGSGLLGLAALRRRRK